MTYPCFRRGMWACVLLASLSAHAAVLLQLRPAADTSLIEVAPTNNSGAQTFLVAGVTQNGPKCRALLRFDVSGVPTNAVVQSAAVWLSVTHKPADGYEVGTFSLHRMGRSWGEGTKTGSPFAIGQGEPATEGEATWFHAFSTTNAWSQPGAAAPADLSPWESAYQVIYGLGESPFLFESTTELVEDVQQWIRGALPNYGWILLCADEETRFTARRFGSREDPANAPVLDIRYAVAPVLREARAGDGEFAFLFTALPLHTYYVEEQEIGGTWTTTRTIQEPAETEVWQVVELAPGGCLYRLRVE